MSGFEEILAWALENFPPEDFDNSEQWFQSVSSDFLSNNRNSLENILDSDEIIKFKEAFVKLTIQQREVFNIFEQNIFSGFRTSDIINETSLTKNQSRGTIRSLFQKGLIERVSRGLYRAK